MDTDDFTLEEVLALGGTKEEYEMLKDIESKKVEKANDDTFDASEFKTLVKSLGFTPLANKQEKKTKKKLNKPLQDNAVSSSSDPSSVKSKSEKSKNKASKKDALAKKIKDRTPDKSVTLSKSEKRNSKENNKDKDTPTNQLVQPDPKLVEKYKNLLPELQTRTLVKNQCTWHEVLESENKEISDVDISALGVFKQYAEDIFSKEIELCQKKNSNKDKDSGNASWVKTVSSAGTLSDRVSALTLLSQENCIHNFRSLEILISMTKKKGRREAIMGMEAVRDLMLGDLLPKNRRLKYFKQQDIHGLLEIFESGEKINKFQKEICQKKLLLWIFEDKLKTYFKSFVDLIKQMAMDPLEMTKTKAMKVALNMLLNKPEQEKEFLSILVNKLGDPKYKIASKSLYMLNSVVHHHPMMQSIIVHEVRDLLLRPNLAPRAQYYCVCFLSSQILSHDRKDVAKKLIQIYMAFFNACVKAKKHDSKMLSALLTGVNRAFPYADLADQDIIDQLDVLFKCVHVAKLSTTVQALVLLFQVFNSRNEISDRFYNALYATILNPELTVSTVRHPMFLNLIYRSLKADPCEPRVKACVKRLLQVCSMQKSPFTAAVLVLVNELTSVKPSLAFCFFGNKLTDEKSVNVGEPTLEKKADPKSVEDDEEEHFVDVDEDSDENINTSEKTQGEKQNTKTPSSWTHQHHEQMRFGDGSYDALHRNPQYAGAEKTSLWELHIYSSHFHPTVSLFSKNLLTQSGETHSGNPLDDFTLIKFLDRFVYRNPKSNDQTKSKKGQSVKILSAHRRKRHETFNKTVPVNSTEFLQKQKLSPEEVFFHKYFSSQAGLKQRTYDSSKDENASDVESISDGEFEEFVKSAEGQKQIDHQLNFSAHVYKNRTSASKDKSAADESDSDESGMSDGLDDEEVDFEAGGYGFAMEEGEDDLLADAGSFEDVNAPSSQKHKTQVKSTGNDRKRPRKDVEKFSLMLEENSHDKYDSITSSAVSNRERASAKQLKWEKKQEMKEAVARKRSKLSSRTFGNKNPKRNDKRRFGMKSQRKRP